MWQINALKAQERTFAEERNYSSHRISEIRSQLKEMLRLEEKIAEGENKVYSMRSELSKVRRGRCDAKLVWTVMENALWRVNDGVRFVGIQDLSDKEEAMVRKLKGQATKCDWTCEWMMCAASAATDALAVFVCACTRQARHIKECLKLTKELLIASARDASLALRVGAQQVRVEFTAKQLKRAEQMIRYVLCCLSACTAFVVVV